jgi:hypothetical protein
MFAADYLNCEKMAANLRSQFGEAERLCETWRDIVHAALELREGQRRLQDFEAEQPTRLPERAAVRATVQITEIAPSHEITPC